jgi:hypothetical protein
MQEVKPNLLYWEFSRLSKQFVMMDGRTDKLMDGSKPQFRMGQMNMNETRYAPTK